MVSAFSTFAADYYECRDASGHITFGSMPCLDPVLENGDAQNLWRNMRGLVQQGWKINASIGPSLPAIIQCIDDVDEMKEKVANIKGRLDKIEPKNKNLTLAYDYLEYCSECRVAAESDGDKSSAYLGEAVNELTPPMKELN